MTDLDELWERNWERAMSIAWRASVNSFSGCAISRADRIEAALDGIIAEVAENGWPEGSFKVLFKAADTSIRRAAYEAGKHGKHWAFWIPAPGIEDPIGERVSDRLGVHQVTHALTETEWSAVWACSEVQKWGGGNEEAAAMLGISLVAYKSRLHFARVRARELWIAPGEHPAGSRVWASGTKDRRKPRDQWLDSRRNAGLREDRRAELAAAVMSGTAKLADVYALSGLTNENIKVGTIRQWIRDGDLAQRGVVERRRAYSVDEFVRLAIERGRLGNDPRKQPAA